jgi:uncharacterized protein (TIGR04255 family)
MTAFKPANADHAVISVAFSIELDGLIPAPVIDAMIADQAVQSKLPWIGALPAVAAVQAFTATLGAAPPVSFQKIVQFAFLRPNGQPSWLLRVGGDQIHVECTQYTRWERIWETARSYIEGGFGHLVSAGVSLGVRRISLQVVDKFEGLPAGYNASDFLRADSIVGGLPFTAGDLWHVNTGWFEFGPPWGRALNNFNLSTTGEATPGDPGGLEHEPFSVNAHHLQQAYFDKPAADLQDLNSIMDQFHNRNKDVLRGVFADGALELIGLGKAAE